MATKQRCPVSDNTDNDWELFYKDGRTSHERFHKVVAKYQISSRNYATPYMGYLAAVAGIAAQGDIKVEILTANGEPHEIHMMFEPLPETLFYPDRRPSVHMVCKPHYISPCPGGENCICEAPYTIDFGATTLRWRGGVYALCVKYARAFERPIKSTEVVIKERPHNSQPRDQNH